MSIFIQAQKQKLLLIKVILDHSRKGFTNTQNNDDN